MTAARFAVAMSGSIDTSARVVTQDIKRRYASCYVAAEIETERVSGSIP